jgi:hypothetical protein
MQPVNEEQLRQFHKHILKHFATHGMSPTFQDMQRMLGNAAEASVEEQLSILERSGAIYRDPQTGLLQSVYPFSAVPTAHRVQLATGVEMFAMCAIDALGMPFMLDTDAKIHSSCHSCRAPIEIEIRKGTVIHASPQNTIVWYTAEKCQVAALDQCPHINFFCSAKHVEEWKQHQPKRTGKQLSLAEAVERGRQVFGSLLKSA